MRTLDRFGDGRAERLGSVPSLCLGSGNGERQLQGTLSLSMANLRESFVLSCYHNISAAGDPRDQSTANFPWLKACSRFFFPRLKCNSVEKNGTKEALMG